VKTCPLCASNRFCARPGRLPGGGSVRCTRDPGHPGEHAACGENEAEHPIFRWATAPSAKRKQYRSRTSRVRGKEADG
jgi:hypothetical protein